MIGAFIGGVFVGSIIGVFLMALMVAASRDERDRC